MGRHWLSAVAGATGVLVAMASAPVEVDLVAPTPVVAGENHAAVIVDTGQTVKKVCVTFSEASISGAEALRRADLDAVFASYGEKGEAVCAICGVGCPAGDCFCDRSRFWAYHRAAPGSGYAYSRAGAAATTVRDGDVEGWRWGTGAAPPYASVGEVCGVGEPTAGDSPPKAGDSPPPPAPLTEAPAPADPPAGPPDPDQTPPAADPPAATASETPPAPRPAPVPGATGTAPATPAPGATDPPAAVEAPPADPRGAPEGEQAGPVIRPVADRRGAEREAPTPVSVAALLLVLGGLVGWRWRLRRSAQVRRAGGGG